MPPSPAFVTLGFALAACAPSRFTWGDPAASDIARYRAAFAAAAGERLVATKSRDDFLDAVEPARVLWLGDHHRSSRLHGLQLSLLEQLAARGVRPCLLLEAIGSQDQADVDAFVDGSLTLTELCQRVRQRWPGSWLDDRELDPWFYRSLLSFARRHRLPVLALEPTPRPPLAERDARIATIIRTAAERHPDRLLVVLVGQAHLVGKGALVARASLGGTIVGGELVPALRQAPAVRTAPGSLAQSDGGLWWFTELWRDP